MTKDELVQYARRAGREDKDQVIARYCSGKTILDVGCIGQDRNYTADNWLHNKVKKLAAQTDGVDILVDEIAALRKMGYSMYSVDELKATQNLYDVVLMADVIEHVDDPVSFLKFYAGFLKNDGVILVTTPNANRANNFVNILFNNNYSVNPEHTFWFCPRTFSEVTRRAGLAITEFFWGHQYYSGTAVKGLYQKFKYSLAKFLIARRTNFSPNMIFLIVKN